MKVIHFSKESSLKHLIIKDDSITIYYAGFDELMQIMNMAEDIHQDADHPFTFVLDHNTEGEEKIRFHEGIDEKYTDEGHYHFEKKKKGIITKENFQYLVNSLLKYQLITETEKNSLISFFSVSEKPMCHSFAMFPKKKKRNPAIQSLKPIKKIVK